ncbi:MAG: hypothetical protein Q9226_007602 [Calogaya cf. arnoldii]
MWGIAMIGQCRLHLFEVIASNSNFIVLDIDHVLSGPDITVLETRQSSTRGVSMKIYVVEHLDPECGPWSTLEYITIAKESTDAGAMFCLSSAPIDLEIPESVMTIRGFNVDHRSVEDVYQDRKDRVCLLDPAAKEELQPADAHAFDIFVFGGILGDDPPRDRTSELRKKGFTGRRLGPIQMTTDTAVRVTRMVIQGQS